MHIRLKNCLFHFLAGLLLLSGIFSMSCQTVKPYQRSYLNDSAMKMGLSKGAGVESYAQMIREGASGAGGKNGGGCGCN
jgi:hypothetical protein